MIPTLYRRQKGDINTQTTSSERTIFSFKIYNFILWSFSTNPMLLVPFDVMPFPKKNEFHIWYLPLIYRDKVYYNNQKEKILFYPCRIEINELISKLYFLLIFVNIYILDLVSPKSRSQWVPPSNRSRPPVSLRPIIC